MNGYLITIPEAVELLGVSKYYIYKAIASGTFESKEFEGRQFIVRSTIENFISE